MTNEATRIEPAGHLVVGGTPVKHSIRRPKQR